MTKKLFVTMLAIMTCVNFANAQAKNESQDSLAVKPQLFNSLKKAGPNDIDPGQPLMLNPSETPMFKEDFSLIELSEFMSVMMSNEYVPEPYIDSSKVVRAFVLRRASDFEKKQMKEMQNKMQNKMVATSPLVGAKAFDFNVTDISGNEYSLKELKGKVIVMNFWFVECKPCIMEMPELNKLVEKYRSKDVVFLGFSTSEKPKVESLLKKQTFNYNIVPSAKNVSELYEVLMFPTHIVVDKKSTINYCVSGLTPTTFEDLDRTIESLLN
jgi:peroxiredoxin